MFPSTIYVHSQFVGKLSLIENITNDFKELVRKSIESEPYKKLRKQINKLARDNSPTVFLSNIGMIADELDKELLSQQLISCKTQADNFIQAVYNQDHRFNTDNFSTRIHSRFTRMHSMLRSFLKHGNKPLVEFDIIAAQMAIVSVVTKRYCEDFFGKKKGMKRTEETTKKLVNYKKELESFNKLVNDGTIYEKLGGLVGLKDRKDCKVATFGCIFANSNNKYKLMPDVKKIHKAMSELYPSVCEVMYIIKQSDYKNYSQCMQCEERGIITEILSTLGKKEFKITIHDAILVTAENIREKKKIIKDIIFKGLDGVGRLKTNNVEDCLSLNYKTM